MIRKPTHKLIELVLQDINKTVVIDSITSNGTAHTLTSSNTLWIYVYQTLTIGGDDYTVTAITPNVEFVIEHATANPAGTTEIELDLFEFRHGTPMATDREVTQDERQEWEKLPMMWLREVVEEEFTDDPESSIERNSNCEFHFISAADFENWRIVDHSDKAIQIARNMAEAFHECLKASQYIANLPLPMRLRDVMNWGVISDKGTERQLFSVNASGCIANLDIPFLLQCCEDCD